MAAFAFSLLLVLFLLFPFLIFLLLIFVTMFSNHLSFLFLFQVFWLQLWRLFLLPFLLILVTVSAVLLHVRLISVIPWLVFSYHPSLSPLCLFLSLIYQCLISS